MWKRSTGLPLFTRYAGNPILTQNNWPYPINSVFNAGAVRLPDGDTLLLCRVEDRRGLSHLCAARSANGIDDWRIDPEPTLPASPREYPEEIWGIEDPRITYVPELEQYAVAYTSFARGGPGVSLALTKDFKTFERYGVIMQPEDKDAALLPRRIGGLWALIHRPVTTLGAHMWISYSPDFGIGEVTRSFSKRAAADGGMRTRLASVPRRLRPTKGWLTIYHGVRQTASGSIYRLGLALFDLERPDICLKRGDSWMFGPEAPYERGGDVKDVVFPAVKRSARMEIRSTCITGLRIHAWLWPPAASVRCFRGLDPTPAHERDFCKSATVQAGAGSR